MYESHWLALNRSPWAGDAGDRRGEVDRGVRERAPGHGLRGLAAHRAMHCQDQRRDAEHLLLRLIAVSDEAALEHIRRAGNLR